MSNIPGISMSALIWFVVLYLAVSIGIGLYAATRVKGATDYVVAGRRLPLYMKDASNLDKDQKPLAAWPW